MSNNGIPATRPQVLTREETQQATDTQAPAKKSSGIRIKLEVDVDKEVVLDAMREVPGMVAKITPHVKDMMPSITDSAVKLVGALGPEAQKMIGAGLASAASQFGALVTTAAGTAKDAALAPVRGAKNLAVSAITAPFKIAAFGADLVFGNRT
jgi:hypothetical protein